MPPPFLDLQRIRAFGLTINEGLISKSMKYSKGLLIQKKRIKILVVNFETKHKSKPVLE